MQGGHFRAAASTTAQLQWHEDGGLNLLTVRARLVDSITDQWIKVHLHTFPLDDPVQYLHCLRAFVDKLRCCRKLALAAAWKANSETDLWQYWRTMIGDIHDSSNKAGIIYSGYYEDFEEYNQIVQSCSTPEEMQSAENDWPQHKLCEVM